MDCPVCFDTFDASDTVPYILPCGHTFCRTCVQRSVRRGVFNPLARRLFCPTCRADTLFSAARVNFALRDVAATTREAGQTGRASRTSRDFSSGESWPRPTSSSEQLRPAFDCGEMALTVLCASVAAFAGAAGFCSTLPGVRADWIKEAGRDFVWYLAYAPVAISLSCASNPVLGGVMAVMIAPWVVSQPLQHALSHSHKNTVRAAWVSAGMGACIPLCDWLARQDFVRPRRKPLGAEFGCRCILSVLMAVPVGVGLGVLLIGAQHLPQEHQILQSLCRPLLPPLPPPKSLGLRRTFWDLLVDSADGL